MEPHPRPAIERRFVLSIALTTLILLAEVVGGIWTGSLALLSDAAHVFMDVFALTLSFVALRIYMSGACVPDMWRLVRMWSLMTRNWAERPR